MLVAHELGPLAPLIGRTVVMRDGRVAYDGPPLDVVPRRRRHGSHGTTTATTRPDAVDHAPATSPTPLDRTTTADDGE